MYFGICLMIQYFFLKKQDTYSSYWGISISRYIKVMGKIVLMYVGKGMLFAFMNRTLNKGCRTSFYYLAQTNVKRYA